MTIMHPDQMSDEYKKKKVSPMTKEEWLETMKKKGFRFERAGAEHP